MASQREKLLESAQRFILKGQIDKAIKDYQQVVALDPKDTRHRQRLAELLVRTGRNDEAVSEYEAIGKFYADNGYYLKAIAVYKQIQKLTPENIHVTVTLGSLNGKQGLTGNALDEYRTAVNYFEKNAQLSEAVKVVEKMLEVDPDNPATCQKLAELLYAKKEPDTAFDAYMRLLTLLQARGDSATAEKIETRIANLFPDRAKVSLETLASMIDSDVDSAIGKLSGLIKQDSSNLPAWQLLIKAYQVKNDQEKLKLTYELVIRLFPTELFPREGIIKSALAAGKHTDAVDLLDAHKDSFLEQDCFAALESLYLAVREHCDDERVTDGLRELYRKSGETEKFALLEEAEAPDEPEIDDLVPLEDVEEPTLPPLDAVEEPAEPDVPEIISESPSDPVKESLADHGDSWEVDIYLSIDDDEDLEAELEALEEDNLSVEFGEDEGISLPEEQVETVDAAILSEPTDSTDTREVEFDLPDNILLTADDASESEDEAVALDLELSDDGLDLEEFSGPEIVEDELPVDTLVEEEPMGAELTMEELVAEPLIEDDLLLVDDAEAAIDLDPDADHGEELSLDQAEEILASEELEVVADEPTTIDLEPADLVTHDHLILISEEEEELSELSLTDAEEPGIEELSFDISKGIDQLFDQFDEAITLEEEHVGLKSAKYSWDGMLSGTDEEASLADAETHFDLGIAYKEMGLYDDAIAEFKRAEISPNRKLDCLILQAGCYREKGDFQEAEDILFDAMTLKDATTEDILGLKYELALVYETCGRLDEALVVYHQVRKENPEFHGVSAKIASLEGEEDSLDLIDPDYEELEELEEESDSGSQ